MSCGERARGGCNGVVDVGAGHLPGLGGEVEGFLADGAVGVGGEVAGPDEDGGHGVDDGFGGGG